MGADERDGGGAYASQVSARPENLRVLFENGRTYVSRLESIFNQVSSSRAATSGALGGDAALPDAVVAKSSYSGNADAFAELISEATYNNGFVQEIHDQLLTASTSNGIATASTYSINQALWDAGYSTSGQDLSLSEDQARLDGVERVEAKEEVRAELEEVLAQGREGSDEFEPHELLGMGIHEYIQSLEGTDADRQALVAEVLVEYGIELQAGLDPDDDGYYYDRQAALMLATQGMRIYPTADTGELVDQLATDRVAVAGGGRRPALELLIDALDPDDQVFLFQDDTVGVSFHDFPGDSQSYFRQQALDKLVGATVNDDGEISTGGQRLVNYLLDTYPRVVELSDDARPIPVGTRWEYATDFDLRATLATALAAPNYGLSDHRYGLALRVDEADAALDGDLTEAQFNQRWLERNALILQMVGGDQDAALLVNDAMSRGIPAAEALRMANFAEVPDNTNDRVRRVRVVYETNPFGQPVDPAQLEQLDVPDAIAQSLMIELVVLQSVQEARYREGRPDAEPPPLSQEQVELVGQYAEYVSWLHHFGNGWALGHEEAIAQIARGDEAILHDLPPGLRELAVELSKPENSDIWRLLPGAADNDTFLGPNGEYRANGGRDYVLSDDPEALAVQMFLVGTLGPHHTELDFDGDGTVHEDEVERWLNENRNNPNIPPSVIDQIEAGRSFGLGEDTFGWEEVGEAIGWLGLAAAVTASIVYSGGAAAPLWVKAGLIGLAGLEAYAFVQADDPLNAVLAATGGLADVAVAARLIKNGTPAGINDELLDLARRSNLRELNDLAARADGLSPEDFVKQYENILSVNRNKLAQDLITEGYSAAEVTKILDEIGIPPDAAQPVRVIELGPNDIEVRRNPGARANASPLQPNTIYQRNDYYFVTDANGRPITAEGQLTLNKGNRTREQTKTGNHPDARAEDEGGHLIGAQFDGPTDAFNLVPQLGDLNRGAGSAWVQMETEWADALRAGSSVEVKITPIYADGSSSIRPVEFEVEFTIDGVTQYRDFPNT